MIFKNKTKKNKPIVVVSGLPRSGTSMMMKMLDAGGIPPLTDHEREADEDNPKGYYEFERVKQLKDGDFGWLPDAEGKAVKVIAALLTKLPSDYKYEVLFMRRAMPEILASQRNMLVRRGEDPNKVNDQEMTQLFEQHMAMVLDWAQKQGNIRLLEVDYNQVLKSPEPLVDEINSFFGGQLNVEKMLAVVDPELYRQRHKK